MNKRILLSSMLLIGALLLGACSSAGTSANGTPGAATPLVPGTEGTALPGPVGTNPVLGPTGAVAPTSVLLPATPVAVTGTPMAVGTSGIPATGVSNNLRASQLIGYNVQDPNNKNLGAVKNLVIETPQSNTSNTAGRLDYLLVSIPNGDSNLAVVPWNQAQINSDAKVVTLKVTADQLKNAPTVNPDDLPDFSANDWQTNLEHFWTNPGALVPENGTPAANAITTATAPSVSSTAAAVSSGKFILAKTLMDDYQVKNGNDERLGEISDLVINLKNNQAVQATPTASVSTNSSTYGSVSYLVLQQGGIAGIGAKYFPIPWDKVTINRQDSVVLVNVTQSQLTNAPSFGTNWPDLFSTEWNSKITNFWNNIQSIPAINGTATP